MPQYSDDDINPAIRKRISAAIARVTEKPKMTLAEYDKCFAQGDPITKLP